jgi:chromosome segregation ATPase
MKRNESSFQKLITDLTDSLTKTRISNGELTDLIAEYQNKNTDHEFTIQHMKETNSNILKENHGYKEQLTQSVVTLDQMKSHHTHEINSLQSILQDYSTSLSEMKPIIEENQMISKVLFQKGYKGDVVSTVETLTVNETRLIDELKSSTSTYQQTIKKSEAQINEVSTYTSYILSTYTSYILYVLYS